MAMFIGLVVKNSGQPEKAPEKAAKPPVKRAESRKSKQ